MNNIKFFLSSKNKYEIIINNIEDIINKCNEIEEFIILYELNAHEVLTNIKKYKKEYTNKLESFIKYKISCEEQIKVICNHNYVEDYIDITPDYSKKIKYCKNCECTCPSILYVYLK